MTWFDQQKVWQGVNLTNHNCFWPKVVFVAKSGNNRQIDWTREWNINHTFATHDE